MKAQNRKDCNYFMFVRALQQDRNDGAERLGTLTEQKEGHTNRAEAVLQETPWTWVYANALGPPKPKKLRPQNLCRRVFGAL